MIGQSLLNVRSGGRTRLSTLASGVFLLFFILVLSKWLVLIPMGALVAVMFMVSIGTFDWSSLRSIRKAPLGETIVMLVTVATVAAQCGGAGPHARCRAARGSRRRAGECAVFRHRRFAALSAADGCPRRHDRRGWSHEGAGHGVRWSAVARAVQTPLQHAVP
jgi:hypothetical protein